MLNFTRRLLRATACSVALIAAVPGVASPSAGPARSLNANLPLTFEKNTGRYAKEVQFVARSGGGALFLTSREMVLSLRKGDKSTALRLKLQGSNAGAVASGLDKQPGVVNYFLGNDAKKWRTNVPTYSRVKLAGVYPGIDLVTYGAGKSRTLEYDFVVKPGADASRIRMAVSGAKSLRTVGGKLIASTACGDVTLNRPYAYQTLNGVRKQVACSFTLERNAVGFQIARYDASRPLVVDPTLEYSTYLGGRALDNCRSFAVDAAGAAYIAGYTESGNYPATSGAYDTSIGGTQDAMVTKLAADGKSLVYSTYLGGGALDYGQALAVDSAGNAYIAGKTASPDFPTSTDAFDTTYNGGSNDWFVTKLAADGSALAYSTYVGGNADERASGLAVDRVGAAYVAGTTDSSDFPTSVGAFDTSRSAWGDAAVVKLAADGKTLVYGTYLGGADAESANGIAVDGAGAAYVAGYTQSADFPTTADAYDVTANGGYDFFITKVNADGKGLAYSTYVGGASHEYCNGMTIDGDGCAYVTGNAMSDNFPTTAGAFGVTRSGEEDVAVVKLSADGKSLAYSTLLGGSGSDLGYSIAVDSGKAAYVTGATWSSQFPTTADAYDTTHNGTYDVFVAKVAADGKALAYATFLGGASADYGKGIAVSGTGSVTVAGYTSSSDFPTTAGAYDTSYNGNAYDAIVARFSFGGAAPTLAVDSLNVTEGTRVSLRGRMTDAASAGISGKRLQFSIDFGAWANSEILTNATGYATLTLTAPAAGVHTLACRFEAADGIPEGSGSGTLTTTSLLATTTAVMDRTAGPSDAVSLLAYLQTQSRAGIAGKQMEFQFNGGSWTPASAVTEATGKATLAVTAPATAGDYTINARFIGDATYTASSGTAKLTVAAKRSVYVYTMNRSGKVGAAGTLIAYFYWYQKNGTLTPVSGKSLRFVCAGVSLDSTVATDAAGRATVSVTPATVGAFPFTVDFTADADYNAGSGSGTLTVAP